MPSLADRLVELHAEREARAADVQRAEKTLAAAKKAHQRATEAIHQEIKGEAESRKPNLFHPDVVAAVQAEAEAKVAAPADDGWRATSLVSVTAVSSRVVHLLSQNDPPILTVGDVLDWKAGGRHLTDVTGVGMVAAAAADKAIADWLAQHGGGR